MKKHLLKKISLSLDSLQKVQSQVTLPSISFKDLEKMDELTLKAIYDYLQETIQILTRFYESSEIILQMTQDFDEHMLEQIDDARVETRIERRKERVKKRAYSTHPLA